MTTIRRSLATTGGAGVIAATVAFLPAWEGMDRVAKRDPIGTGHPITYCYGQTAEFGDVAVGTVFTKKQCDEKLTESLPKYLAEIDPCVRVDLPDKTFASLLDGAWNAGSDAVCKSPMLAKMNAGDLEAGCNAFDMWRVTTKNNGVRREVVGLIDRRAGELHGDHRKSERALCLEGLREAKIVEPMKPVAPVLSLPPVLTCPKLPAPVCPTVISPSTQSTIEIKKTSHSKRCFMIWNVTTKKESKICL